MLHQHRPPKSQFEWDPRDEYLVFKCAGFINKEMIAKILGCKVGRVQAKARANLIDLKVIEDKS